MGGLLDALDVEGSRKNGFSQMFCGGLCIVFNIAILAVMAASYDWLHDVQRSGAGIWGGVFYIVSGALIFVSAKRRDLGVVIPALVMNVISLILSLPHLAFMSLSVMSWKRTRFAGYWDSDQEVKVSWSYTVYVSLFSISTILAYVAFALSIWAIVLLSEAIYWKRYNDANPVSAASSASSENVDASKTASTNHDAAKTSTNHALATASIKVNAVLQVFFALIAGGINVAVVAVVVWGIRSPWEEMNQTVGTAIITSPFYFVLGYFGFTAGKTGSNRRLVTFLCLSVFCTLAAFLEGGGPCVSLANANPGMWLPEHKICTPDPNPPSWDPHRKNCEWVRPENKKKFYVRLIVLNSVIVGVSLIHFLLGIWGIFIASKALHRDNTFGRCFGNCFCGDCCVGGGRGRGGVPCSDGGCARFVGENGPRYQPIQFVVSHQGMTTMADGKQALVVLLPLNENVNVEMEAASATITVDKSAPQEVGQPIA